MRLTGKVLCKPSKSTHELGFVASREDEDHRREVMRRAGGCESLPASGQHWLVLLGFRGRRCPTKPRVAIKYILTTTTRPSCLSVITMSLLTHYIEMLGICSKRSRVLNLAQFLFSYRISSPSSSAAVLGILITPKSSVKML